MNVKGVHVFGVLLLVLCLTQPSLLAQLTEAKLDVIGIAEGPDDQFFAIVRGVGVVQEGDVIPVSTKEMSFKLKIVSITRQGVKLEKFEVVRKLKKHLPAPDKKEGKQYKLRDPFWPVGYDPASA